MSDDAIAIAVYVTYMTLLILFIIKSTLTTSARIKCLIMSSEHYDASPSFDAMLFSPLKWTFAQHYPELAKRVGK